MIVYKASDGTILPQDRGFDNPVTKVRFPAGWLASATDADLAAQEITKTIVADPPPPPVFDPMFYFIDLNGAVAQRPLNQIKLSLKDKVAAERWSLEQGTVEWSGHLAQCDRESRANYVGMVVAVQAGLRAENGIYKFVDGPFPVKNVDVIGLAMAVATRVQDLYTREATIIAQIDALADVAAAQAFMWSWA